MRTALELLLSPTGDEEFFRDYWEQRHLYVKRDDPEHFRLLLAASDLPQVIAAAVQAMRDQPAHEVPIVEIIARGEAPRPVAASPAVAEVDAAFASGSTVRLNQVDRYWPPLRSFVLQLQGELGFITGLSAYCSPAGGRGAGAHFDAHDTVIVQIAGSKRWRVGPGPLLPLETVPLLPFETREEMLRHRAALPLFPGAAGLEELILSPGDVLYVPRGWIHDVQAIDTFTVHLSFGIQQITWVDFIGALAAAAGLRDARLRRSIPAAHHRTEPAAMQAAAQEALTAFAESASTAEAFRAIAGQFNRVVPAGGPFENTSTSRPGNDTPLRNAARPA